MDTSQNKQQTAKTDSLHTQRKKERVWSSERQWIQVKTNSRQLRLTRYTHRERKSGYEVVRDNGCKSNNSRQLRLTGYTHRDNGYETKPTADLLHTQRKKEWVWSSERQWIQLKQQQTIETDWLHTQRQWIWDKTNNSRLVTHTEKERVGVK